MENFIIFLIAISASAYVIYDMFSFVFNDDDCDPYLVGLVYFGFAICVILGMAIWPFMVLVALIMLIAKLFTRKKV